MKYFFLLFFLLPMCVLDAQPLSGNYTVGGNTPDFATPQDAASAIKLRGVSGPVFLNIRPGIYSRDGAAVLVIDSTIAGVSSTNTITFQADASSGGNAGNVILQADFNPSTPGGELNVVRVSADYIGFRHLTFKDADSADTPAGYLIRARSDNFNVLLEGLRVDDCTFLGSPYVSNGVQFGTDYGIGLELFFDSITVTNCRFRTLLRALSSDNGTGTSAIAEDNDFLGGYRNFNGAGRQLGAAIELAVSHASVQHNVVRYSSGTFGIRVSLPLTARIENNYISGGFLWAMNISGGSSQNVLSDSIAVVNNIVEGGADVSLFSDTRNTTFFHNTITNSGGFGSSCFHSTGDNCTILNNIYYNLNGRCVEHGNASGVVSDYNLCFSIGPEFGVHSGIVFPTFEAYQAASHLDSNSHFEHITFEGDSLGLHLAECDAQNPVLNGTPLRAVPFDYYGTIRDTVKPFIGAVEGTRLPYDMFAAPFKAALTGFPASVDTGRFDGGAAPGIAVADYDNREVLLFHNNGTNRTFTKVATLFTGFRPQVVKLFDYDRDGNSDLIVGGDTGAAALKIFWGDGSGGFSSPVTVETFGAVRAVKRGPKFTDFATIVTTEENGFVGSTSFIGVTMLSASREICYDHLRFGGIVDTINAELIDFTITDLGTGTNFPAIVASGISGVSNVIPKLLLYDVSALTPFVQTCSFANVFFSEDQHEYQFPVSPRLSPSIVTGDFDGDGDIDFVSLGALSSYCVLIRNQGNLAFAVDTIYGSRMEGLVALDYDNDGDLDFVTANRTLDSLGITTFLNDGTGHFTEKRNCYFPFASGLPSGIAAADFDLDGKTDIVIGATTSGRDTLYVLYNLGGLNNGGVVTGVRDTSSKSLPSVFSLNQNYPNPFNPNTMISFDLPQQSIVTLKVYNVLGQEVVSVLDHQFMSAGSNRIEFNANNFPSGVYFYQITAQGITNDGENAGGKTFNTTRKMLLVK